MDRLNLMKHIEDLDQTINGFKKKEADYDEYVRKLFEGNKGSKYEQIVQLLNEFYELEIDSSDID